MTLTVLFLGF